jgi:hypothetical protein
MNLKKFLNQFKISNKSFDYCTVSICCLNTICFTIIFHKYIENSKSIIQFTTWDCNRPVFNILFKEYNVINENGDKYLDVGSNGLEISVSKK